MGLLDSLKSLFPPPSGGDANGYFIYVQCSKCGEALRVRVDRRWDLAQEFGVNDRVCGHTLNKDIIGSGRCFQAIHVHQELDGGYKVKKQEITNGKFLTPEEYATLSGRM